LCTLFCFEQKKSTGGGGGGGAQNISVTNMSDEICVKICINI